MIILGVEPGQIARMPITSIKLYGIAGVDEVIIYHLESESSLNIPPVTRANDTGSLVTVGYKIEGSLYIPYNKYKESNILTKLLNYVNAETGIAALKIYFGTKVPIAIEGLNIINSDFGYEMMLSNDMFKISIHTETVELRTRLIIKINGFVRDLQRIIIPLN